MDISAAKAFVLVLSENSAFYSRETQRSLLEGIFQLADECLDNLSPWCDAETSEQTMTSLSLAKRFANDALKSGNFSDGFQMAGECFWPISTSLQEFV